MSGNAFAILAKLGEKKKNVVVDTTTSAKPIKAKAEKKETEKVEKKAEKKAAPKAAAKAAPAAAKKGEALGAKVGGPSSLAKVAAANSVQAGKDAAFDAKKADNKAVADERKKKRDAERAAQDAEKKANQKPESEMTEEEKAAAAKEAAWQAKKKAELEDDTPKVSMKEFQREQNAKRFQLESKNARHVDPNAAKGQKKLDGFADDSGLVIPKEQAKPKAATGKNAKKEAPKTQPKAKKAEAVSMQDLAAKHGNYGARRNTGGRGGAHSGPKTNNKEAGEQAVPTDAAFPDLA